MGELFRQIHPESPLEWTGERMVTSESGDIEAEHYHRYFLARELCRGKDVLDVASGEGYGSAFLAQTARSVVGVDIDPATVEHASREYNAPNLRYAVGDAVKLPIEDRSVDVVVSFETIEHISDQSAFLAEVKRVLRAEGIFLVSTPDTTVYSALGTEANVYHVCEMTDAEFRAALGRAFRHVSLVRQRAITGSVILADEALAKAGNPWIFEQRDAQAFEADRRLLRAPFLLAIASDRAVPPLNLSIYIQTLNVRDIASELKVELQRLRDLEEKVREQEPAVTKAINDAATVPALQAELDRIRKVEDMAREQMAGMAKLSADATSARDEAEAYKGANDSLEQQLQGIRRELEAARTLAEQLDAEREQKSSLQSQLDASASIARQQSLIVQRNLLELQAARQEIESCKQQLADRTQQHEESNQQHEERNQQLEERNQQLEDRARAFEKHNNELEQGLGICRQDLENRDHDLDEHKRAIETYKTAYAQVAGLLIPPRIRSAVPASLKSPLRAMKHGLRSLLRGSS